MLRRHTSGGRAGWRRLRTATTAASLTATAALVLAACGGGGDPTAEVASLADDGGSSTTTEAASDSADVDGQQAALDFAQCMRDNGVDVADPTFDADGNLDGGLFGPDSGIDPRSEATREAMEECGELLENVPFGPGGAVRIDRGEVEAAMADFTECLRDEGLDVGDYDFENGGPIVFGAGPGSDGEGGGGPFIGFGPPDSGDEPDDEAGGGESGPSFSVGPDDEGSAEDGDETGPPPEAFGDPTTRMSEALGLDPDDPAVVAAMEACQPVLENALPRPEGMDGPAEPQEDGDGAGSGGV